MIRQIISFCTEFLKYFDLRFGCFDFILNKEGQFLFNEIEDVVGTRTLYLNYDLDVILLLLKYRNIGLL